MKHTVRYTAQLKNDKLSKLCRQ